jgi:hypothetical protein
MAGLALKLDPSDIVAMGVLELAPCSDAGIEIPVAVLECADRQVAVSYRNSLGRPPTIPTPIVWHVPLRVVELVPIELVVPDECPGLSIGGGRELVGGLGCLSRKSQDSKQKDRWQGSHGYGLRA